MRSIALLFLVCSLGLSAGESGKTLAQEAVAREKKDASVHVTVTAGVYSEYLNKFGITLHDRAVAQGDVTVSVRAPLGEVYAKFWASSDIDAEYGKTRGEGGDELEAWVGWRYKYRDWFLFDQSLAYFDLPPTEEERGDIFISHTRLEILKTKKFLTPYTEYRQVRSMEDGNKKGGGYGWLGIYRAQKIGTLKSGEVKLVADVSAAYSFGALNRDSGPVYWQMKLSALIPITKKLSIVPSFTHLGYFKNQEGGSGDYGNWRKPRNVFGLSLKFEF